jgi:hypothetical protein
MMRRFKPKGIVIAVVIITVISFIGFQYAIEFIPPEGMKWIRGDITTMGR